MKQKILIVSSFFYPVNTPRANRATELAKEFSRQGHDVTVLTVFEDEDYGKMAKDFGITIENLGKRKWKAPDFGQSKFGYLLTRLLVRVFLLLFEFPDIELYYMVKKALKNKSGYDLMISNAVPYPVHWGVARARKRNHQIAKKWVADCGDPYMGCETDTFKKLPHFKFVEKWFMRKADHVTIPVEGAKRGYYEEFHSKISIIPQGFKMEPVPGADCAPNNQVPTFVYAGGFIPGIRDPRAFLEYLTQVTNDFRFHVFTNNEGILAEFKERLGEKLIISSYVPRHELLKFMTTTDFLVNFDNNTGVQLPSKLIDYALVKRPVLNITKELDTVSINCFLAGDYTGAYKITDVEQYRIENVCSKFLNL
ncbi:hypothetical protein EYV94_08210 [Puteibacter caeruleilacunae]|nr:hypothetical protein EYV94_08210 [Puteibacter caeruleilacunae]